MIPHEAGETFKASTDEQARRDALIDQAWATFQSELPLLMKDHLNEWVAYHGTKTVGFGKTRAELWQACLRQGIPEGEFWVWSIAPFDEEIAAWWSGKKSIDRRQDVRGKECPCSLTACLSTAGRI